MADNELCLQEIRKRIMERRKKLGLTREALAEKVKLQPSLFLMQNQANEQCDQKIS